MKLTVTKRYSDIPFAHRAPRHDGKCRWSHGHSWTVEFEFSADVPDENGFVVDFGKLESLKAHLEEFDHSTVLSADDPELFFFRSRPDLFQVVVVSSASSEGLAQHFFRKANDVLKFFGRGARCIRCTVFEDSRNSATYGE